MKVILSALFPGLVGGLLLFSPPKAKTLQENQPSAVQAADKYQPTAPKTSGIPTTPIGEYLSLRAFPSSDPALSDRMAELKKAILAAATEEERAALNGSVFSEIQYWEFNGYDPHFPSVPGITGWSVWGCATNKPQSGLIKVDCDGGGTPCGLTFHAQQGSNTWNFSYSMACGGDEIGHWVGDEGTFYLNKVAVSCPNP